MTSRKQSRGTCAYCGREMTRGGLSRHFKSCPERMAAIASGSGRKQPIYHLQVQDAWDNNYWLHLEMNGSASLEELDYYLRFLWLDCCGHLSMFSYGGWGTEELSMNAKASQVFEPGVKLTHIYDFGTSSETLVRVVGVRQGSPASKHPITLMARNNQPELVCQACDRPAAFLCYECQYEHDQPGLLCKVHARRHPHKEYGEPLPIVNSPRSGMCAYSGPAEPPY